MRSNRTPPLAVFHRIFWISAIAVGLIAGSLELTPLPNVMRVKAASVTGNEPVNERPEESKHIPSNAITRSYTGEMAASDSMLASIFGGPKAVAAANGFEPRGLGSQYPLYRGDLIGDDGRILHGHLSFAMHLYGTEDGTGDTELYVPPGFVASSSEPTPTDAAITFYYPKLGNLSDVTLAVFHIANFHLRYEDERVRIGNIGGPGGSIGSYRHSHIEFYRGNTGLPPPFLRVKLRIDPVSVFTSTTARAYLSSGARNYSHNSSKR